MPPRLKTFDKKSSTTYTLVHRPQNDPLIHDSDAPSHIFAEIPSSSKQFQTTKIKRRGDLDAEFGLSGSIRDNEGEAAEHGIYYDDTSYDYMQHMRDLGGSGGGATWVDAPEVESSGKANQSLEDALRETSLGEQVSFRQTTQLGGSTRQRTYQDQQDVPDAIVGFQPDMDPRLREVLEALDDEEYVDDEDDIYAELTGEEVDQDEWEGAFFEDYDDGWESDDTTKPVREYDNDSLESNLPGVSESEGDGAWMESFAKSKGLAGPPPFAKPAGSNFDATSSAALTSASQLGRRKKRKGALSSSTGFSMTSSALARTEPLSTLDSRFDKIAESYMEDEDEEDFDDNASFATGMSGMSKASRFSKASAFGGSQVSEVPALVPAGFDAILDDFLGGDSGKGRGRAMRKAGVQGQWGQQSGMEQLDEIRKGLGPARFANGKKGRNQKA